MAGKTEIEAVERQWCQDRLRKELFLCNSSRLSRLRMRVLGQRTKVEHLYRWLQEWLATEDGIAFDNGAVRDSIHVHGVPRKYQLEGGWSIRESDLPFLSHGPLVAADGKTILVQAFSLRERAIQWLRVLTAIVGLVVAVLKGVPLLLP
jgi:hypothetical protein